jgi:PiT family inorganic phosphate transporter
MGMPVALQALSERTALLLMAPLALLGAVLAGPAVERTVGTGIIAGTPTVRGELMVVGIAFMLTSGFNVIRIPTSTIQILVGTLVGVALGSAAAVRWPSLIRLVVLWASAPLIAVALGFLLTRAADWMADHAGMIGVGDREGRWVTYAVVLVGMAASFTMGGNDVANATGPLVGARVLGPVTAAAIGGAGLAAGVLSWGRPLLHRVAFDVVAVDRRMAAAAQAVQAGVVLTAVWFGLFTSLNQALIGAMAGAGAARGRRTVQRQVVVDILKGWTFGPTAGLFLGFAISRAVLALAGAPSFS